MRSRAGIGVNVGIAFLNLNPIETSVAVQLVVKRLPAKGMKARPCGLLLISSSITPGTMITAWGEFPFSNIANFNA